ncbi:MAG: hypothetical protein WCT03_15820 [Candidatus Obscuribacterales bacterium]|jgi:hypothetical protein
MKFPSLQPIPPRYAFHISALAWLIWALSEQLLNIHRSGLGTVSTLVLLPMLLLALFFETRMLLSIKQKQPFKEAAWPAVWSKIKAESNLAKVISTLLITLTQPVVLLIIGVATISLASNSARCLAMTLASAGNYEVSERLYKFSNPSSQTSLISVWDCPYQRDNKDQLVNIEQKVSAVASVYGNNSSELADYYAFLAEASLEKALYLDKRQAQQRTLLFEGSQLFGEKSFQIYSSLKNNKECSVALGVIAVDQMSLGKTSEAQHTVANAVDLLANTDLCAKKGYANGDLEYVAKKIGDPELVKQIRIAATSRPTYTAESRRRAYLDATSVVCIAMPIFAMIFLFKAWERSILTLIFRKKWIQELKLARDEVCNLAALDKLTALELYCGRTQEAQIYSQKMLQTALADA